METRSVINHTSNINHLSDTEKRWFAVYTRFRCEKFVAEQLRKKQIEVYLPLISKTRRYARKIKHTELPLINCYIFVHINKSDYVPVLDTEYVLKFLKQGKDLISVSDAEIDILKRVTGMVDAIEPISADAYNLGDEVEVTSGQLIGLKGKIISRAGKKNFVIELENIGFQLRINIAMSLLKPVQLHKIA
ncbi:MAG: UpxY family transcription antiterminator [Saprospiraceae bacterium]|nr:MAG: NGN domain-containing protein [Bacteroidetes bacterium OLB9]MCO6464288.1 UpxY family transcription antiterminator [Saprospiraceae bacterium]MCZ2337860.1 UpxY family transcription antiterminator [Chitinophagales bacterium]